MSDLSKKKKRKCWLGENTGPAFNSNKTEKGGGLILEDSCGYKWLNFDNLYRSPHQSQMKLKKNHLFQEFLQSHFSLSNKDDIFDNSLILLKIYIPHLS